MSKRTGWVVMALLVTVLFWAAVGYLSRQPTLWAIQTTRCLFGWMLLETGLALSIVVMACARQQKVAAFCCVIVGCTLSAAVGLAEAFAAFRLLHWRLVIEQLVGAPAPFTWQYQIDPALGWRRPPNERWSSPSLSDMEMGWSMRPARHETLTFTYDRWGYRNLQTVLQADVVLLGDSYIEGANVNDDEIVARRLEARLGRPVENMGVSGYGTMQALVVLDKEARRLDPKVVVWFFFEGNDLYDDEVFEKYMMTHPSATGRSREGMAKYDTWGDRSFVINALHHLRRWSEPVFPNQPWYCGFMTLPQHKGERVLFSGYTRYPWDDRIAARWTKAMDTLRQGMEISRERGLHLVLGFVPIKERVYWRYIELPAASPMRSWTLWPSRERFADFCHANNVPCVDLTPVFEHDLEAGNLPYLPTDSHWSAHGHDLVAARVHAEIEARGWLK
jgi:hypothetical protein